MALPFLFSGPVKSPFSKRATRAQRLENCAKNGEAKVRGILFVVCVSD
jgi:hypothetical protein